MTRLTLYTAMITGKLAFAAATFLLQAQPIDTDQPTDTAYLSIWNSLTIEERDDAMAMIASAPEGTANTFDYYKNLIDRNADDIPAAIGKTASTISASANVTKESLYLLLRRERNKIQQPEETEVDLPVKRAITNAVNALWKNSDQNNNNQPLFELLRTARDLTADDCRTLHEAVSRVFQNIGTDGDFSNKKTVYDKLGLALTKLNEKTGKPKLTITPALDELDKMTLGNCEQHKALVDARSTTKTLQAAINAVNGQPKHATNKTYGLLGNLKTTATATANGTPLAEHDIYRRLTKGIAHLNTLLAARDSGSWPDDLENLGAIIDAIPNIPHTTESNGGGG